MLDARRVHPHAVAHLRAHTVVSTAELRCWMTPAALRWAVSAGELVRLWHGVYCLPGAEDDLHTRLVGLDLASGTPVTACLDTAAQVLGFSVAPGSVVHAVALPGRPGSRAGVQHHQRAGAPLGRYRGRLTTMPAWTAVELAASLSRPRALATLDAALATGLCRADELSTALQHQAGRRGTVVVGELLALASGDAESPMESETRLVVHDGGVPRPQLQHWVHDAWGRPRYRLDLAWPDLRVAVEYDGFTHHSTPADLRHAHERDAWLAEHGWSVLHVTADDVRRRPEVFLRRLRRALAEAASR